MAYERSQEEIDFVHSKREKTSKVDYCETGWDVPTSYAERRREFDEYGYEIETEDQS